MKFTGNLLVLFLLITSQLNSQENKMNIKQSGIDLVKTEYAFAELTKNSSVRNGFAHYIARDGILFRPGPVNGLEFLEHSSDQSGMLLWYPSASFISSSGNLGVNSGPWEFKNSLDEESLAFGQFLTVWEKQDDGSWEFLIDLGISHPKIDKPINAVENSTALTKNESPSNYDDIIEIERAFESASAKDGYNSIVNDETTILRNNRLPINNAIKDEFLSQLSGTVKWETLGGKSSKANDLAYTYGKGTALDEQANTVYEFYYLHVWINEDGKWKLLYDVVNEIQQ